MALKGVLLGCLLVVCWVAVDSKPQPNTLHASCKLTWTFTVNCPFVHDKIRHQMIVWNISAPCGSSEKCGYTIKTDDNATITGTHTTPVHHYVDDLTMNFAGDTKSCTVKGYSTSEIWYAVLDDGTNYCNLHNLVVGAGINNSTYGFKEVTDNSICTEYSSANCDKY